MPRQGLRDLIDKVNMNLFPKVELKQFQGLFVVMDIRFCIRTQATICLIALKLLLVELQINFLYLSIVVCTQNHASL